MTVLTGVMRNDSPYWLVCLSENVSLLTAALFLNEIAAVVVSLVRRRWAVAFVQFAVGSGLLILLLFISFLLLHVGLGEPSKDYFTRKHGIPRNVSCREPKQGYFGGKHDYGLANCSDEFSQSLFRASSSTDAVEEAVSVSLSALDRLAGNRREFLLAYLAAHPGWWLHEDNGRLCATRRWEVDGRWFHPLHGYYSGEVSDEIFQTRTTLGFPDFVFGEPEHAHPLEGQVKIGSNSTFAAKACHTTYHAASMRCVFDFASGTIFASVAAVFPRNAVSFSKPVCRLSQKSAVVPK